jgi:KDO2-lipid IV(A) lauroyltransferase
MQWIGYLLTRLVAEIFRFIPFRMLYGLSDGLAFLLRAVVGYRTGVVYDNLRRAFPEKTEDEIKQIARASYRNLMDVTLETLKSYTMPLAEIQRRCPPVNPELVNQYLDRGQSVILAGSHYNNWEYTGISMPPAFHGTTVTAYKPISNRLIDRYVNWTRARTGMVLISMDSTFAVIRQREREQQRSVYVLLSDQSPSSKKSAHWVNFLGRDTASLPGLDVLARKFKLPVLYYHVRRLNRGFYEVEYFDICADPAEAAEADITRAYARRLEGIIREQPENWLWSHKRWKMVRE